MPKSSTPALLPTMVRPFTPLSTSAWMRFSGMPHRPKPPAAMVMLSLQQPLQGGRGVWIYFFHCMASRSIRILRDAHRLLLLHVDEHYRRGTVGVQIWFSICSS